ncbi:MAG TPA: DegV family protein [Halanaerobiales bacterium]|nr:DegV family protein [Halanaerobiales bacterium]HPZ63711.1 DegV family protein [Halanaerobiales bacterium]HQD04979.1 DegV family protein [Halanaerobiales bacterium]
MEKIKILADSTCDLSEEILKENNISLIPFYVTIGEEKYKDRETLTTRELYQYVEKHGELPKTSAPTPEDFRRFFQQYVEEGYQIIYISISSDFSSGYQNASLAARDFAEGQVDVVDSRNLSTGIGLLVMKAVDLLKAGKSKAEIVNHLNEIIPLVRTAFIIDNMDYLHKGGRCTSLQKFLGNMLKFRVEIRVVDGKMEAASRIRGSKIKAYDKLINNLKEDLPNVDKTRVFVTHSMEDEGAEYLKEELANLNHFSEILETKAGCVISSHCGPGTIGVLYIK